MVAMLELAAVVAPGRSGPAAGWNGAHDVGGVAMLAALNAGGRVEVALFPWFAAVPPQVSEAYPLSPEFPNAFDRYTKGGVPVKYPIPPRSWFVWSPVISQLKDRRGET